MADFNEAYNLVKSNEGGYVANLGDGAGETYRGITRNNWSKWPGWKYVDAAKPLKRGQVINNPVLEQLVANFYYQNFWIAKARGDKIKNQGVANFIMDSVFNSNDAPKEVVNKGVNRGIVNLKIKDAVNLSSSITDKALAYINAYPQEMYTALISQRKSYYQSLKKFAQFGKIWLERLASFPSVVAPSFSLAKKASGQYTSYDGDNGSNGFLIPAMAIMVIVVVAVLFGLSLDSKK